MVNKRKNYLSWDEAFMQLSYLIAQRSKDPNTQNGACLVDENKIIVGLGYNGFPRGCSDDELPWDREGNFLDKKYAYVVHAEENAVYNANKPTKGCIMYCTMFPCNECVKTIIQNGIKEVVYDRDPYHNQDEWIAARKMLDMAGVKYRQYSPKYKLKLEKVDNKQKTIIGIVGLTGAGKDALADYLKNKGFAYSSLSDPIREECLSRGLSTERDNLINVANELRQKFGHSELAKRSLKKIKESKSDKFVIVSIRHPEEVEYLKNQGNLKLIAVEAAIELRYQRISQRGRPEDFVSFEKFKEQEERERFGSGEQQQLDKVISMADFKVDNSGSLEDLYQQVDKILEKINEN